VEWNLRETQGLKGDVSTNKRNEGVKHQKDRDIPAQKIFQK
jgi:hypothetical protein